MLKQADGTLNRLRNVVVLALKLGLGTVLICWLAWTGRFDARAYGTLLHKDAAYFLLGVFLGQWIMLLVPLVRWWLLVRAQGLPISLGEAIRIAWFDVSAIKMFPDESTTMFVGISMGATVFLYLLLVYAKTSFRLEGVKK